MEVIIQKVSLGKQKCIIFIAKLKRADFLSLFYHGGGEREVCEIIQIPISLIYLFYNALYTHISKHHSALICIIYPLKLCRCIYLQCIVSIYNCSYLYVPNTDHVGLNNLRGNLSLEQWFSIFLML